MDEKDQHDASVRRRSGSYNPGPVNTSSGPTAELSQVQAWKNDVMLEEFPDGPYGAATDAERLGKSTAWRPGQAAVSAFRDQNPVDSDRKVPLDEPDFGRAPGSIEGQN